MQATTGIKACLRSKLWGAFNWCAFLNIDTLQAPIELSMLSNGNNLHLETEMTNVIEFLSLRRSVTAKTMAVGNVDPSHLDQILAVGIRVPDHGALKPWRLVVISGAARARLDSEIIHAEFTASNPNAKPEVLHWDWML